VTSTKDLLPRSGKGTQLPVSGIDRGGKQKRRLSLVELASDLLHRQIIESFALWNHGKRIGRSAKTSISEKGICIVISTF